MIIIIIIETDLYTKPTDKHQHLLSSSCHPHHTKKAIQFSLARGLRLICSTDVKFKLRINEPKTYLLADGYYNIFLEEQFLRAANISRTNALQTKPKDSNDIVPFVVTYNPALPLISNILRKHFYILHSSNRCKGNRLLLLSDVALIFVTFQLKQQHNYSPEQSFSARLPPLWTKVCH